MPVDLKFSSKSMGTDDLSPVRMALYMLPVLLGNFSFKNWLMLYRIFSGPYRSR